MSINRSKVNALVDDDGSGTVGTLYKKQNVVDIYDDVDAFVSNWLAYTPVWTGLTLGNSSMTAVWARLNKAIVGNIFVSVGSSAGAGAAFKVSLPVPAVPISNPTQRVGDVTLFDVSAGLVYTGSMQLDSGTVAGLYSMSVSGANIVLGPVTSVAPFTWAPGDQIWINWLYREA